MVAYDCSRSENYRHAMLTVPPSCFPSLAITTTKFRFFNVNSFRCSPRLDHSYLPSNHIGIKTKKVLPARLADTHCRGSYTHQRQTAKRRVRIYRRRSTVRRGFAQYQHSHIAMNFAFVPSIICPNCSAASPIQASTPNRKLFIAELCPKRQVALETGYLAGVTKPPSVKSYISDS